MTTYNGKKQLIAVMAAVLLTLGLYSLVPSGIVHAAAAANGDQFLAFTSDVHNKSDNVSAARLDAWIRTVRNLYGDIDYMGFCGDMANASRSGVTADIYWSLVGPVMETV